MVLESPAGKLVGMAVKTAAPVGPDDFRGLEALAETTGKRFLRGLLLYQGHEVVPFGRNLHAVPISTLWQA